MPYLQDDDKRTHAREETPAMRMWPGAVPRTEHATVRKWRSKDQRR